MRHRVAGHRFNRDTNARKALLRELVRSLVEQGHVVTTRERAKETRRIADKLIHRAKSDTVQNRRLLHRFFGKRDVVNTLVERVAPLMKDRLSGFTSLEAAGLRRGDDATLARVSLIVKPEKLGTLKSGKSFAAPKTKKASAVTKKTTTATKAPTKKATTKKVVKKS